MNIDDQMIDSFALSQYLKTEILRKIYVKFKVSDEWMNEWMVYLSLKHEYFYNEIQLFQQMYMKCQIMVNGNMLVFT